MKFSAMDDKKMMLRGEFGKYFVQNVIGMGGMSIVYHAVDRNLNREVALKILKMRYSANPAEVRRFQREVKITQQLRHPNIIDIYEYGELDNFVYLAMEYMPGGSLDDYFANPVRQTLDGSAQVLKIIAEALDFAHSQGVLHRDVKLSNILIDADERLVLSDFGLALSPDSSRITQSGQTFGTPIYVSPEQIEGKQTVDHRGDIYSLGVIAYLFATGYFPFLTNSALTTMNRRLTENPPLPSQLNPFLPKAIDAVLLKGLARRPDDRYSSADALAQAFEEAIAPIGATEIMILTTQPTPMAKPSKRNTAAPINNHTIARTRQLGSELVEPTIDYNVLMQRYRVDVYPTENSSRGSSIIRSAVTLVVGVVVIILIIGLGDILPRLLDSPEMDEPESINGITFMTGTPVPTFTMAISRMPNLMMTALPTGARRPSMIPTLSNVQRTQQPTAFGTVELLMPETEMDDDLSPRRTQAITRTIVSTTQARPSLAVSSTRAPPTSIFPTSIPPTSHRHQFRRRQSHRHPFRRHQSHRHQFRRRPFHRHQSHRHQFRRRPFHRHQFRQPLCQSLKNRRRLCHPRPFHRHRFRQPLCQSLKNRRRLCHPRPFRRRTHQ